MIGPDPGAEILRLVREECTNTEARIALAKLAGCFLDKYPHAK